MVTVSRKSLRVVMGVALGSLCLIVFTGALVRLTGSGLGCADWPQCSETKFVDVSSGHTLIEQANRLFTGFVSVSVILAVLLSYLHRPRRRDLVLLSWGLIVGVLVQIVIGGVVVLTGLNPFANMAHFLVSMILITNAFVLFRRASGESSFAFIRDTTRAMKKKMFALFVIAPIVVVTGTVVTATGPHAGDENAVRFGFALTSVARIHSVSVLTIIALIIVTSVTGRKSADKFMQDAIQTLLLISLFQGAIGYTQYLTDVPVFLVSIHIIGAISFWLAVCNLMFHSQQSQESLVTKS